MGRASRDKGGVGEREAAECLSGVYPDAHRRIGQVVDGAAAADVEGTPFWVEVEYAKRTSPNAKARQAMAKTDGRAILVLTREVSRRRSGPWLATMRLDELLDLLRRIP